MSTSTPSFREEIAIALYQCRIGTLKLFHGVDCHTFCCQTHPEFSPVGWHLGHIAYTEDLWLLQRCAGLPTAFPEYHRLFAADSLPKKERVVLPKFTEICSYLDTVRKQILEYLETAPIEEQERLWRFIIQHESQHCETIAFLLLVGNIADQLKQVITTYSLPEIQPPIGSEMITIPGGEFIMGNNDINALDNERNPHTCHVETYAIDPYPVTCYQYRQFMASGGYENPKYWSKLGWNWLQANSVNQPLYWSENPAFDHHPVYGVSWYEAEAYCQFVGRRLPTEAEWEKAASWSATTMTKNIYPWGEEIPAAHRCNHDNKIGKTTPVDAFPEGKSMYGCWDMLGNVWEWTDSWFDGYEGFESYPYQGYSQTYFDGEHRVLKGGSWATRPWALRASFRNWYHPGVRQIIAGFRCAK
jgi:iron(II)-dependent oxidoreductase